MKKIITIFCLTGIIVSCSKEDNVDKTIEPTFLNAVLKTAPTGMTSASEDIYNDILAADYELTVIANANYGLSDESIEANYVFGGVTPSTTTVTIDGVGTFDPNWGDDSYMYQEEDFSGLFGTTVDISGNDDSNQSNNFQISFYVPEEIKADLIPTDGTNRIEREGDLVLSWNPDSNNPTDQIAIYYEVFGGDMMEGNDPIDASIFVTDDDGAYDFSHLVSNNDISQIKLILIRGNSSLVETSIGQILLNVRSEDHHFYDVY